MYWFTSLYGAPPVAGVRICMQPAALSFLFSLASRRRALRISIQVAHTRVQPVPCRLLWQWVDESRAAIQSSQEGRESREKTDAQRALKRDGRRMCLIISVVRGATGCIHSSSPAKSLCVAAKSFERKVGRESCEG
jgi:hypothetical protein